jgi:hypothetical protein
LDHLKSEPSDHLKSEPSSHLEDNDLSHFEFTTIDHLQSLANCAYICSKVMTVKKSDEVVPVPPLFKSAVLWGIIIY